NLIVERRDGGRGLARRPDGVAQVILPAQGVSRLRFPAGIDKIDLGIQVSVARRMALIKKMRIEIADGQKEWLGGILLIEKHSGFGGEQIREITLLGNRLPVPVHRGVVISGAVERVPEAEAVLRLPVIPQVPVADIAALVTGARKNVG